MQGRGSGTCPRRMAPWLRPAHRRTAFRHGFGHAECQAGLPEGEAERTAASTQQDTRTQQPEKTARTSGLSVNCRHSRRYCPPESKTTAHAQISAAGLIERPRAASAVRHARDHGQRPLASRSSNARGTPAARVVPKKSGTLQDEAKPWPKPGPMLTRQRALLRRPQPPRRLNRRQPACPAPPPHR
jgi:hypothetical protein